MSFDEIRFDMSREGLIELDLVLAEYRTGASDELVNFHNQIRNLIERVPAAKKEDDWL